MDGAVVGRVGHQHRPLREVVADEIREAILDGHFRPGDRLVEDRLADELGVSRNPVREALRTLESEGYVHIAPRRGATVARLSDEEGRQILEVRGALEALASRLAARRCTDDRLAQLRALVDKGIEAIDTGHVEDLPALHTQFHALVVEAAENRHLAEVIRVSRDKIQWLYAAEVEARGSHAWHEHAQLVDAIERRDEDLAAVLASRHIDNAKAAFAAAAMEPVTRTAGAGAGAS